MASMTAPLLRREDSLELLLDGSYLIYCQPLDAYHCRWPVLQGHIRIRPRYSRCA